MINIQHYLKPKEQSDYANYVAKRLAHIEAGTHCWMRIFRTQRLIDFKAGQESFPEIDHVIVYEDPFDMEAPVRVCRPQPMCVHQLLFGGVHAPIEAHLEHKLLMINSDGSGDVVAKFEADEYAKRHDVISQHVVDYRRVHDEVMQALSYEKAIEWIMMKDVPYLVWANNGGQNRRKFAIADRSAIPHDCSQRNAWRLGGFHND